MLLIKSLAILMCATYCLGTNTRMICEELDTSSSQSEGGTHRILQGIPGKKGLTGEKGSPGPPGPSGPANEEALLDLKQAMSERVSTNANRLDQLTERLALLEESYVRRELLELCDFIYAGKCFFLLMHEVNTPVSPRCRPTEGVNKPEAEAACSRHGGRLANIYDEVHYQKVLSLMRSRTPISHDYNHIWTGMTVAIQARRLRMYNGNWAPYLKWYPNRPFTPARMEVGIFAYYETKSHYAGMFDEHKTCRVLGGICEKAL